MLDVVVVCSRRVDVKDARWVKRKTSRRWRGIYLPCFSPLWSVDQWSVSGRGEAMMITGQGSSRKDVQLITQSLVIPSLSVLWWWLLAVLMHVR